MCVYVCVNGWMDRNDFPLFISQMLSTVMNNDFCGLVLYIKN